jgi:hypothetical protein
MSKFPLNNRKRSESYPKSSYQVHHNIKPKIVEIQIVNERENIDCKNRKNNRSNDARCGA